MLVVIATIQWFLPPFHIERLSIVGVSICTSLTTFHIVKTVFKQCVFTSLFFLLKDPWQFCFIHLGFMFASANFCASGTLYKQHVQCGHCHLVHSVTAVLASRAFIHFVILAVGHFRIPYVPGPGFSCA
jgi:hypothetical protein